MTAHTAKRLFGLLAIIVLIIGIRVGIDARRVEVLETKVTELEAAITLIKDGNEVIDMNLSLLWATTEKMIAVMDKYMEAQ